MLFRKYFLASLLLLSPLATYSYKLDYFKAACVAVPTVSYAYILREAFKAVEKESGKLLSLKEKLGVGAALTSGIIVFSLGWGKIYDMACLGHKF